MNVVRQNVKRIIRERGLKQSALALKAKIPEKQLSALICGRKLMRPEYISQISVALGVTPNALFGITSNDHTA